MPGLLPALSHRRALRAFDPRPVPPEVQEILWQAVSLAPSHGNTQPARIVIAESADARAKVVAALSEGNRSWAPAAPLLFALLANPDHSPSQPNSDGSFREFWAFNMGIATGSLLAQATELGLTAHPMAGFDEPAARAALGVPGNVRVAAIVAIGYPGSPESLPPDLQAKETAPQERIPLANLVAKDRWSEAQEPSARELRKRQS
jgi:nitroreductase